MLNKLMHSLCFAPLNRINSAWTSIDVLTAKVFRKLSKRHLAPAERRGNPPHENRFCIGEHRRTRKTSDAYNSGDLSPPRWRHPRMEHGVDRGVFMQTTLPPFRWYIHRHLLDDSVWACPDAIPRGSLAWMHDLSLLTMNYRVPLAGKLRPRSRLSALMLYVSNRLHQIFSAMAINFKGHIVALKDVASSYRSFDLHFFLDSYRSIIHQMRLIFVRNRIS